MDQCMQAFAECKCRLIFIGIILIMVIASCTMTGCGSMSNYGEQGKGSAAGGNMDPGQIADDREDLEMSSSENDGFYAYDLLNSEEKKIYNEILSALEGERTGRLPADTAKETVEKLYRMVMADHPELFYITGYDIQLSAQPSKEKVSPGSAIEPLDIFVSFKGRELLSADSVSGIKEQLESLRREVLDDLPGDAGEYEKARRIYDYVVLHTVYGGNAVSGQTADSALIGGRAVCTGYARAAQYLLQGAGIQSMLVTGRRGGGNHAWLLVKLDGDYYFMDPTEGDSLPAGMPSNYRKIFVNYAYFAMTSADTASKYRDDGLLELPECKSQADSYFTREGRYAAAADESEMQQILQLPEWTADPGLAYLQVRCSKDSYEEVRTKLSEDERVANNGWICIKSDEFSVLTFFRPVNRSGR